jgi:hypothetical protein
MAANRVYTDDEMLALDVPAQIRAGLADPHGPDGARLRGDAAVAAAITVDRLDARPRSLTFLSEMVRRGGRAVAANLAEPLPTPELAVIARTWLDAAADVEAGQDRDDALAQWLETVAGIVALRRRTRGLPT